jgi:hypothetical protein
VAWIIHPSQDERPKNHFSKMSGEGCMAKIAGGRMKIDKFGGKLWIVPKKESEMSERMASTALRTSHEPNMKNELPLKRI